eukprot:jgi/Tetstr1/460060/TSEL_005380.t1
MSPPGPGQPAGDGHTPGRRGRRPGSKNRVQSGVAPAARRGRKKKTTTLIPHQVAAVVPESAYFSQLLDFERRIDQVIARRTVDIKEALKTQEYSHQKLRLYIYNTHENQASPGPEDVPGWTLVLYGRLVAPSPADAAAPVQTSCNFSSLLKKLEVQLDAEQYPDQAGRIVWDASTHAGSHSEAFEIKRAGARPCRATIKLTLNCPPERYQLSNQLAAIVGVRQECRPRILRSVWSYIKRHRLQSPANPMLVECDAALLQVLGEKQVQICLMDERISAHLKPAQPIELEYTIDNSGESPTHPECYEIDVEIPINVPGRMADFLEALKQAMLTKSVRAAGRDRELETYQARITHGIEKINEHRRRRAFFLGFSQSPIDFINTLVASQGA